MFSPVKGFNYRKLEIQVLGARPMSEVGFRDVRGVQTLPTAKPQRPAENVQSLVPKTEIIQQKNIQEPSSTPITKPSDIENGQSSDIRINSSPTTPSRKPTIIRPKRPGGSVTSQDTETLVPGSKGQVSTQKNKPTVIRPSQRPDTTSSPKSTPTTQRKEPPQSLDVKKDPWNQIAKNDGLKSVSEDKKINDNAGNANYPQIDAGGSSLPVCKPAKSIMDQSLENNFPVELQPTPTASPEASTSDEKPSGSLFISPVHTANHKKDQQLNADQPSNHQAHAQPVTNKPSALQRIYEAKKMREEKQPDKYKWRHDCYVDKPNNDADFWKPSNNSEAAVKPQTGPVSVGPRCVAKYDFQAETAADLSFSLGDIIRLTERVDEDWFKGELEGKRGTFPVSFVEVIEDLSGDEEENDTPHTLLAMAAFEYNGTEPNDLALKMGQEVKVLAKIDSEWLYGEAGGKSGIFPALFVSVGEDDIDMLPIHKPAKAETANKATESTPTTQDITATALYDFTAEHPNEISLKVGVKVQILDSTSGDWTKGRIDDRIGLFPTAFVQLDSS